MTWQAWLTAITIVLAVVALARDIGSPAMVMLMALIALLVFGVIDPAAAFSGFANTAPITVAALYVLAKAVQKTGALEPIVRAMLGDGKGDRLLLARILPPVAGVSAFLNNTPIVAVMAPQISAWCERRGRSAALFLMPLSFATILGGTVTLIGTSTNLVVSGMLENAGHQPLGMFELTPIGLPVALIGVATLVLIAPGLLPKRSTPHSRAAADVRAFTVTMGVVSGGPLDGVTVEAGGLRHLQGVFLVELQRGQDSIAPVSPETRLHGGDQLTFAGRADLIIDLHRNRGLASTERPHLLTLDGPQHTFFEAVIGEASPLVGKTLREVEFRGRYQAAVVAIHRAGQRVESKLGSVPLKIGDLLLLLADRDFPSRWRDRPDFLLIARAGGSPPMKPRRAAIVGILVVAMVVLSATGLVPILQASLLMTLALIVTGVLTTAEARAAVDLDVILVIAAGFGLGAAMEQSGLATHLANGIIGAGSFLGPTGALFGVVIACVLLTELITNNAAAALMFPIGMATALQTGSDPRVFAIAIAIAASASFLTPIGYQTNTMVYGMGGYRFSDFGRVGGALTVIVVATIMASLAVTGRLPTP